MFTAIFMALMPVNVEAVRPQPRPLAPFFSPLPVPRPEGKP